MATLCPATRAGVSRQGGLGPCAWPGMLTLSSLRGSAVPLEEYRRKRDRQRTPEPIPAADPAPSADGHGELFVTTIWNVQALSTAQAPVGLTLATVTLFGGYLSSTFLQSLLLSSVVS